MNELLSDISATQLRRAADLKERIDSLQQDLNQILGSPFRPDNGTIIKRRTMSPAAIEKIRVAAKERWAAKKGKASGRSAAQPKKTRSAAVRARLSAIAKARWKKAKAAGKHAL